jgi:hypothetical protein
MSEILVSFLMSIASCFLKSKNETNPPDDYIISYRGKGGGLIGYIVEKRPYLISLLKNRLIYSCNSTITKNNTTN